MGSGVRNIVVGAALLVAVAGIGWYAKSNGDAQTGAKPAARNPGGLVNVRVATVGSEPFAQDVEAIGTARANEAVDVTAKISNRVTAIAFREGQQVKAGDVLVEFDSEQVRANLAEAEAALLDSRSQFNRSRELFATHALSASQLDQLQATLTMNEARVAGARAQLNDTVIRAPFAGRVGLRNVSLGGLVSPGDVITTLDDLSVIKLDFSVPEIFLATLKPGLTIEARSSAYPDETFAGRVASVDTRIDPTTRSVAIRALIDNRDGRLRPGMFMTLRLVRREGDALMLPEQAIVPEGDRHYVYIVAEGRAHKREVQIGRRRPGQVEILQGLTAGDSVVVDGTLNMRDGIAVRAQNGEALADRSPAEAS